MQRTKKQHVDFMKINLFCFYFLEKLSSAIETEMCSSAIETEKPISELFSTIKNEVNMKFFLFKSFYFHEEKK